MTKASEDSSNATKGDKLMMGKIEVRMTRTMTNVIYHHREITS